MYQKVYPFLSDRTLLATCYMYMFLKNMLNSCLKSKTLENPNFRSSIATRCIIFVREDMYLNAWMFHPLF